MPRRLAPSAAAAVLFGASLTSTSSAPLTFTRDVIDRLDRIRQVTYPPAKDILGHMLRRSGFDPSDAFGNVQSLPLDRTLRYVIVPYFIDSSVERNAPDKFACIRPLMDRYEDVSSLRFVAVREAAAKYVLIARKTPSISCAQTAEPKGGGGVTEFLDNPCNGVTPESVVAHEIMHLLGFQHVHQTQSLLGIVDGVSGGRPYLYSDSNYSGVSNVRYFPPTADALAVRAVFGCHGVEFDCDKEVKLPPVRPQPVKTGYSWSVKNDDPRSDILCSGKSCFPPASSLERFAGAWKVNEAKSSPDGPQKLVIRIGPDGGLEAVVEGQLAAIHLDGKPYDSSIPGVTQVWEQRGPNQFDLTLREGRKGKLLDIWSYEISHAGKILTTKLNNGISWIYRRSAGEGPGLAGTWDLQSWHDPRRPMAISVASPNSLIIDARLAVMGDKPVPYAATAPQGATAAVAASLMSMMSAWKQIDDRTIVETVTRNGTAIATAAWTLSVDSKVMTKIGGGLTFLKNGDVTPNPSTRVYNKQ